MRWKLKLSKLLFGGVIIVAIGIAGAGFVTFQRNLEAMNQASQESISWSTAQLEKELMRFRDSLRDSVLATNSTEIVSNVEINRRFDILWSRVAVFQRGAVGERLREYDKETNVVGRLFEEMKRQEAQIVSISSDDFGETVNLHRVFLPYSEELSVLSREVEFGEQKKAELVRKQIKFGANFALYSGISSVLLVVLAMTYFVWEGRRFRVLAKRNKVLADKFERASLSKSRFLTMMSHELRTPMNGVLGLIAVARQNEMEKPLQNLLHQANRSAVRMLDMLTDILDFAALENADTDFTEKPFFTEELVLALPDLLGPVAEQAKVKLSVTRDENLPIMLSGDNTRLRRSYTLMATYFLETAGAKSIAFHLSYANGKLLAKFKIDYLGGDWTPDLIFGERAESDDSFASEVLGPAVARVLVTKMGGEIRHECSEDGQIVLAIEVPVEALAKRSLRVRLCLQSTPMEMICKSTIASLPIEYLCSETEGNAEVILMEAGGTKEKAQLAKMRANSAGVQIIGIGKPADPALYDFVAEMPLEALQLKKRIAEAMG